MREMQQSGGAPAQATAPTAAEMARVDAQLELAAKKAALAGMERAAAQGGDAAPAAPAAPPAVTPGGDVRVITVQQGDKVITLTNPTNEQLAQVGVGMPVEQMPDPTMISTLTVATLGSIVVITWMILNFLRRGRGGGPAKADAETAARMARIENAVDSIAVEVERMSEAQRYTSRLLSEGAANNVKVDVPEILGAVLQNRGAR